MAYDKTSRVLNQMIKRESSAPATPIGSGIFIPNHSGDVKTPVRGGDLANKNYVDSLSGGAPEGTAVKSTGEVGGTKFLREDGDGTCSWQTPSGTGDMTKVVYDSNDDGTVDSADTAAALTGAQATAITTNSAKISFDAASSAKLAGIEAGADVTDTANVTSAGALMDSEVDADIKTLSLPANTTISTFGASLIDDAAASNARTTLGLGTFAVLNTSTDHSTADTAYVPMVLYNTDATPPTASGFPVGTIYIQYTA